MAKRPPLSIFLPAYHTVLFDGVPMWRAQAWALKDARLHGVKFTINSAIRDEDILEKWRGHGLRIGLHSQQYLYDGWRQGRPGFFPANPPNLTSHAGFSDGNPVYQLLNHPAVHAPAGARIQKYQWGIDAINRPGGDARQLVAWLNSHGYVTVRPYPTTGERHHFTFKRSPATNARRRLAAHYAGRKHKR